jgi:uncharacterized DUF497 family protein
MWALARLRRDTLTCEPGLQPFSRASPIGPGAVIARFGMSGVADVRAARSVAQMLPREHCSKAIPLTGISANACRPLYITVIYIMADLSKVIGFEWDEGNARKNEQHGVSMAEAEQVFFNSPLLVLPDGSHSETELRFHALGKTNDRRQLHITFTLRDADQFIRVISARDMHRKERAIYEQAV